MPEGPCLFVANRHGWHDAHVLHLALARLGKPGVLWTDDAGLGRRFAPLGLMLLPPEDASARAAAMLATMRGERSLVLFPEGDLHAPPELRAFGRVVEIAARRSGRPVVPVSIRYEQSLHERPEAFVRIGAPVEPGPRLGHRARLAVSSGLDELALAMRLDCGRFELWLP